jgi:glyceraldehyde 3-phosphate dehydrogenase
MEGASAMAAPVKVGINGFGRIGRLVFRAIAEQGLLGKTVDVVAVNDLVPGGQPRLPAQVRFDAGQIQRHGHERKIGPSRRGRRARRQRLQDQVSGRQGRPAALPWGKLGVEYVIESTGLYTEAEKAKGHITAGAKKVIISAPAKGEDITVVIGVNDEKLDVTKHNIISNASCTTNCLAPVVYVLLKEGFGIEEGS